MTKSTRTGPNMRMARTSTSHPLQIGSIPVGNGLIGVTLCPGKKGDSVFGAPWDRDLATDLEAIAAWGASSVLTLIGAGRPVAIGAPVAHELALDRAPMAAKPPGDFANAQAHLHQADQAASLLEAEVAVSRSPGNPGRSRCRTWNVSLRTTSER